MNPSLSQLLTRLVDYAGLFPPAALAMESAVANYARYLSGAERWMLGRFIVPMPKLVSFEVAAEPHFGGEEWHLSALPGPDLAADLRAIADFNARHEGRAIIDTIESKASTVAEIEALDATVPNGIALFIEIPVAAEPRELIAAIARTRRHAKIRTGGLTADGFPPAAQIARFIARCAETGVAFKATAGLHHPLRCVKPLTYEPAAPVGTMHGFLNVFLAAALIRNGLDPSLAEWLLAEERADRIEVSEREIRWNGNALSADELRRTRESFALSFGSCSFEEPIADLRELEWM